MIIFESILTTFEAFFEAAGAVFKNWLEPKTEPPLQILACQNLLYTLYHEMGSKPVLLL